MRQWKAQNRKREESKRTDQENERVVLEVVLHVGTGGSPLIVDECLRRRNDGEAGGRSVSSETSTTSIVSVD